MSSQLNVDTIVDKAGSGGTNVKIGNTSTYVSEGGSTTQNTVQGMAKAWGTVDNQATNDSFNNSTDTDVGAGQFEHNFTNNFAAANYSSVVQWYSGSVRTFNATNWYDPAHYTTALVEVDFMIIHGSAYTDTDFSDARFRRPRIMASQLKVDTLTGVTTAGSIDVTGEGNSTTTNLQQGLAKCWVM